MTGRDTAVRPRSLAMRTLGFALVAAALAVSAGSVSMRRAAADDGKGAAQAAPVTEYASDPNPAASHACPVTAAPPTVVTLPLSAFHPKDYVNLNTRGYNYATPDDPPERYVPDSTGRPRPRP
jgi:hypothetical protein